MEVHSGAADFGRSIQMVGLFHCLNDSRGTAAAAYADIRTSASRIRTPAMPLFERRNLLTISRPDEA
jgi:hypothetical protein